jgi:hypothetical protein
MMAAPASCAMALKEWATVLEAMARGEQLVLIRKGGLIEPGTGFELQADTFVFYPTFEHQAVNYLRPEFRGYFEAASGRRAPEGQVRFDLVGVAVRSVASHDPAIVERLRSFHVYHDDFLSQRLKWQPDHPLAVVVVRAFRLAVPQTIPVSARYAGCKSWVALDAPVSLAGATPVEEDAAFERRMAALMPLVGAG